VEKSTVHSVIESKR